MPTFNQPSFAKGEIDPALHGRTNTTAYQIALATARNAIIQPYGGVTNRAGLQYIGPVKTHSLSTRLIDFQFKTTDTYIIELGNRYMRFIRNDAIVTETALTGVTVTGVSPPVATKTAHGYTDGDEVLISGMTEATTLNGNRYIVANKDANTFELTLQADGGAVTAPTAETTGGSSGKVYEIVTPYLTADLFELKYTQNADVMTITHPTYSVRELTRSAVNVFTLTAPTFAPTQDHATALQAFVGVGGTAVITYRYQVTAFNVDGEESLSALNNTTTTVSSATAASPVVCTATSHGYLSGDEIELNAMDEMTEVNGRRFLITYIDANSFSLDSEDGLLYTAESTGGTANLTHVELANGLNTPSTASTSTQYVTWDSVAGAVKYSVYRSSTGNYGLVGETSKLRFDDVIDTPDTQFTPPAARNPFLKAVDYPGTVSYFEQRRVFGGSSDNPDTSYFSRTGETKNFSSSSPTVDTDAITATLASSQVNDIRHYVPGNDLLVLTSGAEWRTNANGQNAFTPSTISQKPQSEWGSSHLKPLVVGNATLFVQANQANVRTLGYNLQMDGYTGTDLNLLTQHLVRDYTLLDWCLARHIYLTMLVRSDGEALSLTFQPEQEVIAWTHWDTDGLFKSCASILPNLTTELDTGYFIVERVINSKTVQYIEKLHSRQFEQLEDSFFVDSGLSLDTSFAVSAVTIANPCVVTTAAHGMVGGDDFSTEGLLWEADLDVNKNATQPAQLNGFNYIAADVNATTFTPVIEASNIYITDVTQADPVVVTTSEAHGLANASFVVLANIGGTVEAEHIVYKVANKAATTFELTNASDVDIDGTAHTAYTGGGTVHVPVDSLAFNAYVSGGKIRAKSSTVIGMDHLEGETIVGLLDGSYAAGLTVSGGSVTLPYAASRVHLGMPYYTDIETLDAEPLKGTILDKKKKISDVTVRFNKSRGMLIGPDSDNLVEAKQRQFEAYGVPTRLLTGTLEVKLNPSWNKRGRVFIRQPYPLPMEITSIAPNMEIGD